MQSEMVHLGEVFKNCREEKQLSLKEIESATSIRIGYLQAIEEGHFGKLISPIYARGFLNKYATFLEIDPEQLIREYPSAMKILTQSSVSEDAFALGVSSFEVRGSPGGEVKWLPNLMWVGLSVVGILAFWFFARYLGLF